MARRPTVSLEERMHLVELADVLKGMGQPVTLDGHRATVAGYRNDFATVIDLETGNRVEFAWPTVKHILHDRRGKFKS